MRKETPGSPGFRRASERKLATVLNAGGSGSGVLGPWELRSMDLTIRRSAGAVGTAFSTGLGQEPGRK